MVDKARKDEKDDDSVGVRGGEISVSCRDEDQQAAAKHDTEVSKLPPGHWMCSVCKEVGASSELRLRSKHEWRIYFLSFRERYKSV